MITTRLVNTLMLLCFLVGVLAGVAFVESMDSQPECSFTTVLVTKPLSSGWPSPGQRIVPIRVCLDKDGNVQ